MRIESTGRRSAIKTVTRAGLLLAALVAPLVLSACTTVEGTNAMTDFGTFEREVMTSTAIGVGLVPKAEPKDENLAPRGPLVLPKNTASLPAPQQEAAVAQLPANSDTVQIDVSNLSEADMQRLRNTRVVDMRTLGGRPLTEAEAKALTAKMKANNMSVVAENSRPLYLPPAEYFVTVNGTDLICQTPSGELVSIRDSRCPDEIRKALAKAGPVAGSPQMAGEDNLPRFIE